MYIISIYNSEGYINGKDTDVQIFNSFKDCIDQSYSLYTSIWNESKDILEDGERFLAKEEFEKEIAETGSLQIQCLDSHISFEFFEKEVYRNKDLLVDESRSSSQRNVVEQADVILKDILAKPNGHELFYIANLLYTLQQDEPPLTQEEMLTIAQRILDASNYSGVPLLTAERVDAVSTLLNNGISEHRFPEFPQATSEQIKEILLNCDIEIFTEIIETVAVDNQEFYQPDNIYSQDAMEMHQKAVDVINSYVTGELITETKIELPLQNYDDAVGHLCEILNERDEMLDLDDNFEPRKIEDFIPIFKSSNYFGIYYYAGDNEYYLVDRNSGESKMVLGDSFEFVGTNHLDCMKDEKILNIANIEFLRYLIDFSKENAKGEFPQHDLTGIAVLDTALREENIKKGACYPKPSLAEQIHAASSRGIDSQKHSQPEKMTDLNR